MEPVADNGALLEGVFLLAKTIRSKNVHVYGVLYNAVLPISSHPRTITSPTDLALVKGLSSIATPLVAALLSGKSAEDVALSIPAHNAHRPPPIDPSANEAGANWDGLRGDEDSSHDDDQ